jgi:putative MATE family efflux protein
MDDVTLQNKTTKQKLSIIIALAVPAMIENILQTVVGFVDTLFVAKLGLNEVTAVGVANAILAVYMAVFMAIGVGTSSLVARSIGSGNISKAKSIARQSTILSAIFGLLFGLTTLFFSELLLRLMGAESKVLADSVIYFRIVAIPSIFISLMFTFGSILRASGDTKTPMKVSLWINFIHIGLDYILIFGVFGIAGLGVAGAAWATVIARIIGTLLLFFYINRSKVSFSLFGGSSREDTFSILKLSVPTAVERLIMRFGQVLYFGFILKIGAVVYASHSIAGNIETFSYMPGYGLAIAATTLVGQSVGGGRYKDAYKYGMITTVVAMIFMSFIGALLFFLSPWFATWFTTDKNAIEMVVIALRIDAFAQPALAIGLVLAGALQGAGDTKSPMYSTAIGMWFIRILGVYILGIYFDMGIAGVWLSIAIDLYVRAIYLFFRFKRVKEEINYKCQN